MLDSFANRVLRCTKWIYDRRCFWFYLCSL